VFSHSEEVQGQQWIPVLYEAVISRQAVVLNYKPFEEAATRQVVSPYVLREYNRRWFLIGFSHSYQKIRTYALDRIQHAEQYFLEPFYMQPGFNPKRYFDPVIGVSIPEGQQPEEVHIKVTPLRAKYLTTKPIHRSQQVIEQTDAYCIFSIRVIPNMELKRFLLSLGEEAIVLEPAWLRQEVAESLRSAAKHYGAAP
ncbi:MAG TPA: WYL domain-containing protein, partial [Phaeodactylibacter sp.]|nr:WYL domain-containing protein [Phaeodactylibacter sp.]